MRQAEEILEIAVCGKEEIAIVIDRQGGVRMIDPTGWSLPSLHLEYGAGSVYKVERRAGMLRVEGWNGSEGCLLQRRLAPRRIEHLPGMPGFRQAAPCHLALGAAA